MPALLNKLLNFADGFDMLPGNGLVLVCVSGGADSMCLLSALLEASRTRGFTVGAVHYNHRLRGGESDRDEAFVRDYCLSVSVPFYHGGGDVAAYAGETGLGIEEASRDMRYAFFYETAEKRGALRLATAHTADDNAETIIMNLARGAGTSGLSGIPPVRDIIVRPMLQISRDMVMSFIEARGIPYVSDSTNSLDIYRRNKIRHAVIPVLRELNPRFVDAASAAAALSRADEEYLSEIADRFVCEHCDGRSADLFELRKLPSAISGRVVRKLYGGNLSYGHVASVLDLCGKDGPPASLSLPGMNVFREYGRIVFGERPSQDGFSPVFPSDGESVIISGTNLKMSCALTVCDGTIYKPLTSFLFKYDDLCGKITVRPRREGDSMRLLGAGCTKTLKKLFIERRIPHRKRALIPVVADDIGVLAVYGVGIGDRAIPKPGDTALHIEFEDGF